MNRIVSLLAFVLVFSACDKNNNSEATNEIYGRYSGTFSRWGMDTVSVTFLFKSDNTFEASGERSNYPALCGGTYQQSGNNITVNDTCAWTANFDWTLIFDGNYNISFTGTNSMRIWRTNGLVTDEYLLSRISR